MELTENKVAEFALTDLLERSETIRDATLMRSVTAAMVGSLFRELVASCGDMNAALATLLNTNLPEIAAAIDSLPSAAVSVKVERTDTGATITVTNADGTTSSVEIADGKDGTDGRDGADGKDGEDSIDVTLFNDIRESLASVEDLLNNLSNRVSALEKSAGLCVLTINPIPEDASVEFSVDSEDDDSLGTGSRSVAVVYGTEVTYKVRALGYASKTGTVTVRENTVIDVELDTPDFGVIDGVTTDVLEVWTVAPDGFDFSSVIEKYSPDHVGYIPYEVGICYVTTVRPVDGRDEFWICDSEVIDCDGNDCRQDERFEIEGGQTYPSGSVFCASLSIYLDKDPEVDYFYAVYMNPDTGETWILFFHRPAESENQE